MVMRGRSPGESSSVYPATFPPSIRLIHLAGWCCLSLQGRSMSTSPWFSLYPGGASSNGCFVSTYRVGRLVRWRSSRASLRSLFSTACRFLTHLAVSAIASMIPLSTAGWRFSPWETFRADLGDRAPPCIWDRRLSCDLSGPSILCISWSVRMGYVFQRTCARSSLEGSWGEGGLVDIGDLLLALIDPSADMMRYWKGGGWPSL